MIYSKHLSYILSLPETHPHSLIAALVSVLTSSGPEDERLRGAMGLNYHLARKPLCLPLSGDPTQPDDEKDDVIYVTGVHGELQEFAGIRVTKGIPGSGPWCSFTASHEERQRVMDVLHAIVIGRIPMPDAPALSFETLVRMGDEVTVLPPEEPPTPPSALEQRRREVN